MQLCGETLAKVVKSAVGMCRLVVKQTQKLLKVLSVYAARAAIRGRRCGKCCRYMQVSEETEAEGVESAVGICRLEKKQRQNVWKVLSVLVLRG